MKTEVAYRTPWFDLLAKTMREGEAPYYSLSVTDYVGILAVTTDRRILAVRQYRPAVERYTIEFPAGLVDAGENPFETARRELLEETGYQAVEVTLLGEMLTDTGRLTNRLWAFLAAGVHLAEGHEPEAGIEVLSYSLREFMQATTAADEFNHALHVAILTLAMAKGVLENL